MREAFSSSSSGHAAAESSGSGSRTLIAGGPGQGGLDPDPDPDLAAVRDPEVIFSTLARAADISHRGTMGDERKGREGRPAAPTGDNPTTGVTSGDSGQVKPAEGVGPSAHSTASPPPPLRQRQQHFHSHPEEALLAKSNVEMDRLMSAEEWGHPISGGGGNGGGSQGSYNQQWGSYVTVLTRLLRPELLPTKADLLVGVPRRRVEVQGSDDAGGTVVHTAATCAAPGALYAEECQQGGDVAAAAAGAAARGRSGGSTATSPLGSGGSSQTPLAEGGSSLTFRWPWRMMSCAP